MGITDVLLAKIADGGACCSISREQLLLQRQILQHGLDNVIGIAHRGGEMGRRFHPFDRRLVFAKLPEIGQNARGDSVEIGHDGVMDAHLVPGQRKYLRDAVPHKARADDGDARFRRQRHPAV